MSQSRDKILRRLEAAHRKRTPVTIHRKDVDLELTHGFVLARSADWVVLHELEDTVYLDGFVVLRLDQVSKVTRGKDTPYVRRAVDGLGLSVHEFECAPDAGVRDLILLAAQRVELIGIRMEEWEGEPLFIGKVRRVGRKKLDLQFIGSDGMWVDDVDAWKLKDVTRIEFGSRYIRALERFGDPMPTPAS